MYGKKIIKYKKGPSPFLSDPTACYRSGWEYHVLLWLDKIKVKWEYEPQRFFFAEGTRGAKSYLPDLYIPNYKPTKRNGLPNLGLKDCYVEIRGAMTPKDHMCLVHFQRDHPEAARKLVAITYNESAAATKYYKKKGIPILKYIQDLEKEYFHIPHWND